MAAFASLLYIFYSIIALTAATQAETLALLAGIGSPPFLK